MPLLALLLAAGAPSGDPPPVLVDGDPHIRGSLTLQAVDEAVQAGLSEVSDCYSRALAEAPTLAGRVVVDFTVLPDGSVRSAATASSTVNQFRFEACVNRAYMEMSFPTLQNGKPATVLSALRFTPPDRAPLASRE